MTLPAAAGQGKKDEAQRAAPKTGDARTRHIQAEGFR